MKLQNRYGPRGFVVLGLSLDKNPEDLERFLEREPVNYPMLLIDQKTREAYGGVPTVPYTVLIDRQGSIRRKNVGFSAEGAEALEQGIDSLLSEPQKPLYGS